MGRRPLRFDDYTDASRFRILRNRKSTLTRKISMNQSQSKHLMNLSSTTEVANMSNENHSDLAVATRELIESPRTQNPNKKARTEKICIEKTKTHDRELYEGESEGALSDRGEEVDSDSINFVPQNSEQDARENDGEEDEVEEEEEEEEEVYEERSENEEEGDREDDEEDNELLENEKEEEENDDVDEDEAEDESAGINNSQKNSGDSPLYPGAPLTLAESMIAILCFVLTYNLSGACFTALLELICLHCIAPNTFQKSLYMFKKFFANMNSPLQCHYFCKKCFTILRNKKDTCSSCKKNEGVEYFITLSIITQLQVLFKRSGFAKEIRSYRFSRKRKNKNNYEDIYDGDVYRELSKEGNILSDPNNFSFFWYTDGIPIFKSSNFSIWPVYLTVNELPYFKRTQLENLVLAGLWFGKLKPCFNLFLKPLKKEVDLLKKGVSFSTEEGKHNAKAIIIGGNGDLPAKASVLNMKRFNAIFGCNKCKIRSLPLNRGRGAKRVYPFKRNLELRTDEETEQFAREAISTQKPVKGVLGPTILSDLVYKPIRTTLCDDMHTVYLGVTKMLISLWFDSKHRASSWSLYTFLEVVDKMISSLTPPSFVQRLPRPLKTDFKFWKASELKTWLLYYSLPILVNFMPKNYFEHFKLLVTGIYLLSTDSVSEDDIAFAEECLTEFVSRFEHLYGKSFMTCNLHQLLHFPQTVRDFGPLWVFSCFPFENVNGKLKNLINGTRFVDLQICSAVSSFLQLTSLKDESLQKASQVKKFCSKLTSFKKKLKMNEISETMCTVGKLKKINIIPHIIHDAVYNVMEQLDFRGDHVIHSFYRLFKRTDKLLYTSDSYVRTKRTKSSLVSYLFHGNLKFGLIHSFIRISACPCGRNCVNCNPFYFAILRKCETLTKFETLDFFKLEYIKSLDVSNEFVAVNVNQLCNVCYYVKLVDTNDIYLVEPVNNIEAE